MLCNQYNNLKIKLCYSFSPLRRSEGEGLERICSKLGGGLERTICDIDSSVAPIEGPYATRAGELQDMVLRNMDCVNINSEYTTIDSHFSIIDDLKTVNNQETDLYFYHSDHLGSSSFITDADGIVSQHLQYLPYGELFAEQRDNTARYYTPYKFSGKEKDEETGYSYFGARYYMPELSIWSAVDPMADDFPHLSPYSYCENKPTMLIDPDGNSTHTDENGNVVAVYNDKDLGVYKHKNSSLKGFDPEKMSLTTVGAEKMGETEHWNEFIDPEKGTAMTKTQIQFGKSFDPIIEKMHKKAENMDLIDIAGASRGGGLFDIKKDYPNIGGLLNGKYATSRSAGNFLAGYNAEEGTYLGLGISFKTFQKLAGALHIKESQGKRLPKANMIDIVLFGTTPDLGPSFHPPTYGENQYQYRMSKAGWQYGARR